jgi:hypothetical protein
MRKDNPSLYIPVFNAVLIGWEFLVYLLSPWADLRSLPLPASDLSHILWGIAIFLTIGLTFWRGSVDVKKLLRGKRGLFRFVYEGLLIGLVVPAVFSIYEFLLKKPLGLVLFPASVDTGTPAIRSPLEFVWNLLAVTLSFGLAGALNGFFMGALNRIYLGRTAAPRPPTSSF